MSAVILTTTRTLLFGLALLVFSGVWTATVPGLGFLRAVAHEHERHGLFVSLTRCLAGEHDCDHCPNLEKIKATTLPGGQVIWGKHLLEGFSDGSCGVSPGGALCSAPAHPVDWPLSPSFDPPTPPPNQAS